MNYPTDPPMFGEATYQDAGKLVGFIDIVTSETEGNARAKRVSIQADWRVENGVLICSNFRTTPDGFFPTAKTTRYQILSVSPDESRFKDLSTGMELRRFRKGSKLDVKA
jgi:hypothetical protein